MAFIPEAIDKFGWSDGEWKLESDFEVFTTEAGYIAIIWRMPRGGNLNGYVRVPKEHPLSGRAYNVRLPVPAGKLEEQVDLHKANPIALFIEACKGHDSLISLDCLIRVHGGLTFADQLKKAEIPGWFFGFDTAHGDDFGPAPSRAAYASGSYRNWDYVKAEIESLARQLKELDTVEVPAIPQVLSEVGDWA